MQFHSHPYRRLAGVLLIGTVCAVVSFFVLDHPVENFFAQERLPGDIKLAIDAFEWFGHGLGVAVVCILIFVLDEDNRRKIPRLVACAAGSGLLAAFLKLFVGRIRPRRFDFSNDITQSLLGLMPFHGMSSHFQSIPSGHTAAAVGLAMGLSWLYPKGRGIFVLFAFLVACQRMVYLAHYPSDTIFGAMIGYTIATFCLTLGPLPDAFRKYENK